MRTFPLATLAVQAVGGKLVVVARLIGRGAGDRVYQRDLRARPALLEIGERRVQQILAEDGVVPRAVVAQERVAAVRRDRAAFQPPLMPVSMCPVVPAPAVTAARAGVGLLPEHDVDDPGDTVGVVARRRIGNDLHVIDHVGRHLREKGAELPRLERAGSAVDLDDDARVAPKTDVVVDVDVDRRQVGNTSSAVPPLVVGMSRTTKVVRSGWICTSSRCAVTDCFWSCIGISASATTPTSTSGRAVLISTTGRIFGANPNARTTTRYWPDLAIDTRNAPLASVVMRAAGARVAALDTSTVAAPMAAPDTHAQRVHGCYFRGRSTAPGKWRAEREC